MAAPDHGSRRLRFTPDHALIGLLVVELLLWMSARFRWFSFNQHKGWTVLITLAAVGLFLLLMLTWFIVSVISRRPFQFSIRSLFILTTAVAGACSWLAVELKEAREQREFVAAIERSEGEVGYDWNSLNYWRGASGAYYPPPRTWLWDFLGDDFFSEVVFISTRSNIADGLARIPHFQGLCWLYLHDRHVKDVDVMRLAGLFTLQALSLDDAQITDASLPIITALPHLHELRICNTSVTDSGLDQIAEMTELWELGLDGLKITDEGLSRLRRLTQLQWLSLERTQITDAGLEHLTALHNLRNLMVSKTGCTNAGVNKLRKALPKCTIVGP